MNDQIRTCENPDGFFSVGEGESRETVTIYNSGVGVTIVYAGYSTLWKIWIIAYRTSEGKSGTCTLTEFRRRFPAIPSREPLILSAQA